MTSNINFVQYLTFGMLQFTKFSGLLTIFGYGFGPRVYKYEINAYSDPIHGV
jgi:hypothetical protein